MKLKYIVYITVNLCNSKFYFGVHKTNPEIFDGYIGAGVYRQSLANKNTAFHRAVRKYGYDNFKRTTIQVFPNTKLGRTDAYDLESKIVTNVLLHSKNCYNTSLGGNGSVDVEKKKKVYMFDLNGNYLKTFPCVKNAALYLNLSDEYSTMKSIRNNCLNISNSSFGYYWSYKKQFNYKNNRVKKVAQYTISGKFIRYFNSISDAERNLLINTIEQAIIKHYTSGGFLWRFYHGDNSDIPTLLSIKTKNYILPIKMFDKNMNLIKEYNCVNDCVNDNPNLSSSLINRVLNKIIKSHKGFIFKYKDEDMILSNLK